MSGHGAMHQSCILYPFMHPHQRIMHQLELASNFHECINPELRVSAEGLEC